MSPLNDTDTALKNMLCISVKLDASHFDMSPLNDAALENMLLISVTLDTSHLDMSQLNDLAP